MSVKSFLSLMLAALLLACPQLCRADLVGCCASQCEGTEGSDDRQTPGPVQNDATSCICAGAVRGPDSQLDSETGPGEWSPLSSPAAYILAALWGRPTPAFGATPGSPTGGPRRAHLMLQNFRC
ncbi:hypothetical protein [Planctomyces sp. SH-PL62]|uniref:hypothetical protein n=1 Tax=Planctomyces sp. SH-PL62 TaxID=1636152 RepID=UPI00078D2DB1|nr:hypothetical protein [Planctomyces sp. SH-PL62]AMV40877.1 hypothetical protein VT85_25815 [Planctomyces sp. SH-PL62]